jgi:hypothetical protein
VRVRDADRSGLVALGGCAYFKCRAQGDDPDQPADRPEHLDGDEEQDCDKQDDENAGIDVRGERGTECGTDHTGDDQAAGCSIQDLLLACTTERGGSRGADRGGKAGAYSHPLVEAEDQGEGGDIEKAAAESDDCGNNADRKSGKECKNRQDHAGFPRLIRIWGPSRKAGYRAGVSWQP